MIERLRNLVRPRQHLTAEPVHRFDQAEVRELETEENVNSRPPEGERAEIHAIWVAECYPLSFTDALIHGVDRLGWHDPLHAYRPGNAGLSHWIRQEQLRNTGGAWVRVGSIMRRKDRFNHFGSRFYAELPPSVSYADGSLYHVLPGLFVFVIKFVLRSGPSDEINRLLNANFEAHEQQTNMGTALIGPTSRKRDEVNRFRHSIRHECSEWFRRYIPGIFASSTNPDIYPSCEFITIGKGIPFDDTSHRLYGNYLSVLGIDYQFGVWKSKNIDGLYLQDRLSSNNDELSITLTANRSRVIDGMDLEAWGGGHIESLIYYLHYFDESMSVWAIHGLLRYYETEYTRIRESAAQGFIEPNLNKAIAKFAELETISLRLGSDVGPTIANLADYCLDNERFNRGVMTFTRELPTLLSESERDMEIGGLVDAHGNILSRGRENRLSMVEDEIFEDLRTVLIARCPRLLQVEESIRQIVQAGSSAVNTRSQQLVASSNMRLQIGVAVLTAVTIVVGVVQIYFAWLAYLISMTGSAVPAGP